MSQFRYTNAESIDELLLITFDRTQPDQRRKEAIIDLSIHYEGDFDQFLPIFADKSESPAIRGEVADQLSGGWSPRALPVVLECLQDESVEVRFWAAFALANIQNHDVELAPSLSIIENVVLSDAVLEGWWAVGREILMALEYYFWRQQQGSLWQPWTSANYLLLSPMPEYWSFRQLTFQWTEAGKFYPLSFQTTLRHDPDGLAKQLTERFGQWKGFALNSRQPRLRCYLLDWRMGSRHNQMTGALLHDGYAVVVQGKFRPVTEFVAWYRTIVPAKYPLFMYHWADAAVELEIGTDVARVREEIEKFAGWKYDPDEHERLLKRFMQETK